MPMSILRQAIVTPLPLSAEHPRIQVKAGDKWLLAGTSGSGKTTAKKLLLGKLAKLYHTSRIYIFDGKFDGDFDSYPGRVQSDTAPARPGRNQRFQVWQPVKIVPDEIEQWLWRVRHDAPAILDIDELVYLCYGRDRYSDEYNVIQKTGRSLPIMTLTGTQELSKIPANAYKQATHRLGFYIDAAAEYDRRIRNALLKDKMGDPDHPYGFWYQHINGRGTPAYFQDVQHFLQ